jgi:hypothetical protein
VSQNDRFEMLDVACAVVVAVVAVVFLTAMALGFAAFSVVDYLGGKR